MKKHSIHCLVLIIFCCLFVLPGCKNNEQEEVLTQQFTATKNTLVETQSQLEDKEKMLNEIQKVNDNLKEELENLRIQNETQQKRIESLAADREAGQLELDQLKRQIEAFKGKSSIEADNLKQQITLLEENLAQKDALISKLQQTLQETEK